MIKDLITHVYPSIATIHPDSYFKEHCILDPQNTETSELNVEILHSFPGPKYEFWAVNLMLEDDTNISPEHLHLYSRVSHHTLDLENWMSGYDTQNLQPREGMCNRL